MLTLHSWEDFHDFVEMTEDGIKKGEFTPRTLGSYMNTLADFLKIQGKAEDSGELMASAYIIEQSFLLCRDDENPIGEDRKDSLNKLIVAMKLLGDGRINTEEIEQIAKMLQRLRWRVQGLCPSHGEPLTDYPRHRTRAADCCGHERPYGDPTGLTWSLDPDPFDADLRKMGWPDHPTFKARIWNTKRRLKQWWKRITS